MLVNETAARATLLQITTANATQKVTRFCIQVGFYSLSCTDVPKLLLLHQKFQWSADNNKSSSSPSCALDGYAEILEALMVEGFQTLAHPSLKALHPSDEDKLNVLLDVWGLADRDIVTAHAA